MSEKQRTNIPDDAAGSETPSTASESSFAELAADMRSRTQSRPQTPSEILQREGRDER